MAIESRARILAAAKSFSPLYCCFGDRDPSVIEVESIWGGFIWKLARFRISLLAIRLLVVS